MDEKELEIKKKYHIRTYGRMKNRNIDLSILENNPNLHYNMDSIKNNKKITLEIGFGNGEVLTHRSNKNKEHYNIGVEVYKNGICKVLKYIKKNNIDNIIIFPIDVRDFFSIWDKNYYFYEIYILFPDPWHRKSEKKRNKKRLINFEFLKKIENLLEENGSIFFASDHYDYYLNVKNILLESFNNMILIKETINEHINDNFIESNYEKKAKEKNNNCYFFQFMKKNV